MLACRSDAGGRIPSYLTASDCPAVYLVLEGTIVSGPKSES